FPEMDFRSPRSIGGTPVHIHLYVEDVDAVVGRALASGAKVLRPVQDQFYGDRSGSVIDPYGHVWHVATHKEDLSMDELRRRPATGSRPSDPPAVTDVPASSGPAPSGASGPSPGPPPGRHARRPRTRRSSCPADRGNHRTTRQPLPERRRSPALPAPPRERQSMRASSVLSPWPVGLTALPSFEPIHRCIWEWCSLDASPVVRRDAELRRIRRSA